MPLTCKHDAGSAMGVELFSLRQHAATVCGGAIGVREAEQSRDILGG